jgi:hypothetical protein
MGHADLTSIGNLFQMNSNLIMNLQGHGKLNIS